MNSGLLLLATLAGIFVLIHVSDARYCTLRHTCYRLDSYKRNTCTRGWWGRKRCSTVTTYRQVAQICYKRQCCSGYTGSTCTDVNECTTRQHRCAHNCINTAGSYTCSCRAGYKLGSDGRSCIDINECSTSGGHSCDHTCVNTPGSYTCKCNSGYSLASNGRTCSDVNECTAETHGCNHVCTNTAGSYTCSCLSNSFTLMSDGRTCQGKYVTKTCMDTVKKHISCGIWGLFRCTRYQAQYKTCRSCATGFSGDNCATPHCYDSTSCANGGTCIGPDLCSCPAGYSQPKCQSVCSDHDCEHSCTPSGSSYVCSCNSGYVLNDDGKTCDVANPCETNNGGCNHVCKYDSPGRHTCLCRSGYTLQYDRRTCTDDNECLKHPCDHTCTNNAGSYTCACRTGYSPSMNGARCTANNLDDLRSFFLFTDTFHKRIYKMDYYNQSLQYYGFADVSNPIAIDHDPATGLMFWTDVGNKRIYSSVVDASNRRIVRRLPFYSIPDGLTLDTTRRKVYYTDTGLDIIASMDYSGQNHKEIIKTGLTEPRAIVLDTPIQRMYWTDWGAVPKIEQSKFDGSNRQTLVSTGLTWPNGLVLVKEESRLYWTDAGKKKIEFINLDGTGRTVVYSTSFGHFFDVVNVGNLLFYSDWKRNHMRYVQIDGRNPLSFGPYGFGRINGLYLYDDGTHGDSGPVDPDPEFCQEGEMCADFAVEGSVQSELEGVTVISAVSAGTTANCSRQAVFKVQFNQMSTDANSPTCHNGAYNHRQMLKVDLFLNSEHSQRSGWQFNLGDSKSNDGYAGDSGHSDFAAEIQGKDSSITTYASCYQDRISNDCKCQNLWSDSLIGEGVNHVTVYIANNYFYLETDGGEQKEMCNKCLFGLDGRNDYRAGNQPADTNVYIAVNRVIGGTSRTGYGICSLKMSWVEGSGNVADDDPESSDASESDSSPSDGDSSPSDGGSSPSDGDSSPSDSDSSPSDSDSSPSDSDSSPSDSDSSPSDSDSSPSDSDSSPSDSDSSPSDGDSSSSDSDTSPSDSDSSPSDGDSSPSDGDSSPSDSDSSPSNSDSSPSDSDSSPSDSDSSPSDSDSSPSDGDSSPSDGDSSPSDSDSSPSDSDSSPSDSDSSPSDGDSSPSDGDSSPSDGDSSPSNSDSSPSNSDSSPSDSDSSPSDSDSSPSDSDSSPSDGDSSPSDGDSSPSDGDSSPSNSDSSPSNSDSSPSDSDSSPSDSDSSPSDSDSSPSDGDSSPSGGDSSPSDGDSSPSDGDSSPSDGDSSPSGGDSSPSDSDSSPSDSDSSPSDSDSSPSDSDSSPSDSDSSPSDSDSSPSDSDSSPSDGDSSPSGGDSSPSDSDSSPSDGDSNPSDSDSSPSDSNSSPSDGDSSPSDGESSPSDGESSPSDGDSSPSDGDSSPSDSNSSPSDGDSSPSDGDSSPSDGESSPSDGDSSPSDGDSSPSDGDSSPSDGSSTTGSSGSSTTTPSGPGGWDSDSSSSSSSGSDVDDDPDDSSDGTSGSNSDDSSGSDVGSGSSSDDDSGSGSGSGTYFGCNGLTTCSESLVRSALAVPNSDCENYCQCMETMENGVTKYAWKEYHCGIGHIWDADERFCDSDDHSFYECPDETYTGPEELRPKCIGTCAGPSDLHKLTDRNNTECVQFCQCVQSEDGSYRWQELYCQHGSLWASKQKRCIAEYQMNCLANGTGVYTPVDDSEDPADVGGADPSLCQVELCAETQAEDLMLLPYSNCSRFCQCAPAGTLADGTISYKWVVRQCAYKAYWNHRTRQCGSFDPEGCKAPYSEDDDDIDVDITVPVWQGPSVFNCSGVCSDAFHGNLTSQLKSNCTQYCHCAPKTNSELFAWVPMFCAAGTLFESNELKCMHEDDVICQENGIGVYVGEEEDETAGVGDVCPLGGCDSLTSGNTFVVQDTDCRQYCKCSPFTTDSSWNPVYKWVTFTCPEGQGLNATSGLCEAYQPNICQEETTSSSNAKCEGTCYQSQWGSLNVSTDPDCRSFCQCSPLNNDPDFYWQIIHCGANTRFSQNYSTCVHENNANCSGKNTTVVEGTCPVDECRFIQNQNLMLLPGSDCKKFCQCSPLKLHLNGTAEYTWVVKDCAFGTKWNEETGNCGHFDEDTYVCADTGSSSGSSNGGINDGCPAQCSLSKHGNFTAAVDTTCLSYCQCAPAHNGGYTWLKMYCAPGTLFDKVAKQCLLADNVECTTVP